MIELSKLTPFGRKQWTKRKWDEYVNSPNYQSIKRSLDEYSDPTKKEFEGKVDRSSWKDTVDKKVNYLLARKPVSVEQQSVLDDLSDFIKESAKQFTLRGSLIWIVQGNGVDVNPQPAIMNNTFAVYKDENRQEPVAFIRKRIDIELTPDSGAETEVEYYELYYTDEAGVAHRCTYCYANDNYDKEEALEEQPLFIELGRTGDAPLYAYVERLIKAIDNVFNHQDRTVEANTSPLTEVRGYTGTSDDDLEYAVNHLKIVKVDGNGGVVVHSRQMDSTSVDLWRKALMNKYYEATCTVGKDNELQYAQSGKAMDRLFVDMENSARELAHTLELALEQYFESIGATKVEIVWNTDRPVDDASIINSIVASKGLLSDKTLLEQHPWVDDPEQEMERLEAQNSFGLSDLIDVPAVE